MLSCRILKKRVLFFPNGTIQILGGGLNHPLLVKMKKEILSLVLKCNFSTPIQLTPWKFNNLVIHFDLKVKFSFSKIICSKNVSYEPELFPAALISKWQPIHVTLFPNGKGNMSGIKNPHDVYPILLDIPAFIDSQVLSK